MSHIVSLGTIPCREVTWASSMPIVNHHRMVKHLKSNAVAVLHALYNKLNSKMSSLAEENMCMYVEEPLDA